MAVTRMNNNKKVRFTEPVTSSRNTIPKRTSTSNLASNKPMLSSTGVKPSTSASGSQPSGNTKKDKIQQTQRSTQKNKVEAYTRKVKSSLKNKDHVVAPKGTAHVQRSKLNANSELKYVKCNGCMLSDNHDLCVLDYINNVNAHAKSKSAKKQKREKITTTTEVPLRKPVVLDNETSNPAVTLVYSRKPRKSKTNVPVSKSKVVQIVLWYLDSGCSKHMTGDRYQLTNYINKFLGTVKFENDHMAKILGYDDYQIGNVMISRVYYVEGLGYNLFSVGQFCDSNLEVAFCQHTCFIRNLEGDDLLIGSRGNNLYTLSLRDMMASYPICLLSKASKTKTYNETEFVNQTLREYYEKVGISHETFVARSPQQNGVVERRNRMLIEDTRTRLIYAKAPLFLWAEVVATACYTQNRSIICLHHGKTPYELLHDKLPDLSFFHVFGVLCYPMNDTENVGKLQPKVDIVQDSNPLPSTPFVPPLRTDWDMLFQPLFDELLNPPPSFDHPAPEVIAPIDEVAALVLNPV
ncbi:integrase, catalytic region, zinc finger, CCHC-type containing protein [Tanacetum coccineum]